MKRLYSLLLSAILALTAIAADDIIIKDLQYTVNPDGETCTLVYTQLPITYDLVIPETIEDRDGKTYTVTAIGDRVFDRQHVLSVVIPNTVTEIGEYAFRGDRMTSLEIPESVTKIGRYAFNDCQLLTEVKILGSLTELAEGIFQGCTSLMSVTLPDVNTIGDAAFSGCSNLTAIEIPNSVTAIGSKAFYNCSNLTAIDIPNSVTAIGSQAFYYCSNLTAIDIPNTVTEIGDYMFYGCWSLRSINLPASLETIGVSSFRNCSSLASLDFPENLTTIGSMAFNNSGLTSIDLPASVTTIGGSAFSVCRSLEEIKSLGSVTELEDGIFAACIGLQSISLKNVTKIGEAAFSDCASLTSIEIPASVTEIGSDAFTKTGLTSVTVPESVRTIGDGAFCLIENLETATILAPLEKIGQRMFDGCTKLNSVTLPATVKEIGMQAFNGCSSLTSIDLPASLETIGGVAFSNCSALSSVTFNSSEIEVDRGAFAGCPIATVTVYATDPASITIAINAFSTNIFTADPKPRLVVPAGCAAAYEADDFWNRFAIEEIGMTIDRKEITVFPGDKATLTLTVTPTDVELVPQKLEWESDNTDVATVDENGVVTAVAPGEATITARATYGTELTAECKVTVEPRPVTGISLATGDERVELTPGATKTLSVIINPADATDKTVEWTSSDVDVATVDADGTVTAVAPGAAIVTAKSTDGGFEAVSLVIVNPVGADGIEIECTQPVMNIGDKQQLRVTFISHTEPTDKSISWMSDDESVAKVDATGEVTAVAPGTATIIATTADGFTAAVRITVSAPEIAVAAVTLDRTEVEIGEGRMIRLTATVTPAGATASAVTWTSSDPSVATVDAYGIVEGIKAGTATITAEAGGKSASCTVTVLAAAVPVESVEIAADLEMTVGEQRTLTAVVKPADATDKSLDWVSGDETIATVDANGTVTALKAGTVFITAVAHNSTFATCRITVTDNPADPTDPTDPDDPTDAIGAINADTGVSVAVAAGAIIVSAPEGTVVEVYSITGALVRTTREHRIDALPRGIYILRISTRTFKVAI